MSADEFRCGMHHYIGSVFNRTDEVRRAESVVHDEDDVVPVGNLCNGIQIGDIRIRVSESFGIYNLCPGSDCSLKCLQII